MIGIFYGSSTGNTESLANEIAARLGVSPSDVYNVGSASADAVAAYDTLLLGSSTWGVGDLQDDWESFVGKLAKENLSGKKVGFFGCGNSGSFPDTFCDALGIIRDELSGTGCTFIGNMDASGYPVTDSRAFDGGNVIGLLADDDEPDKTEERTEAWVQTIKNS